MTVYDVRKNHVVKKPLTFNMILRRVSLVKFFFLLMCRHVILQK